MIVIILKQQKKTFLKNTQTNKPAKRRLVMTGLAGPPNVAGRPSKGQGQVDHRSGLRRTHLSAKGPHHAQQEESAWGLTEP